MADQPNKPRPVGLRPSQQATAMVAGISPGPAVPLPHPALAVGSKLGKYTVTGVVGRGGMGNVYAGEDPLIKRKVAIKVLPPEMVSDKATLDRFLAEAQAAGRLNHANVVTIYEVVQLEESYAIVMELLSSGSVQDYLARKGSPGWKAATRIAGEACKALAAAHDAGLIHRDIKPANLLLTAEGHVKVADFGLAKRESQDAAMNTQPGAILGTPAFMSPEQCRGDKIDRRTDLYSLGCTYYALLTGKPPFEAPSSLQVMFAHCSAPIPDVRDLGGDVPDACSDVLSRALAKDPQERYQDARELLADFRAILSGATTTTATPMEGLEPVPPEYPAGAAEPGLGMPKWAVVLAGGAAAILLVALIWAFWPSSKPAAETAPPEPQRAEVHPAVVVAQIARPPALAPAVAPPVAEMAAAVVTAASPASRPAATVVQVAKAESPAPVVAPPVAAAEKPVELAPQIVNSVKMKLTLIRPGKFMMGDDQLPNAARHEVTLTKAFYLGVCEVSQAEKAAVMGREMAVMPLRQELPAAFGDFEDAAEFCRRFNRLPEERSAGRAYRLPTEAEWEYACRAGTTTKYSTGDRITQLQANFGKKIDLSQLRQLEDQGPNGEDAPPPPPPPQQGRRPAVRGGTAPPQRRVGQRPTERPLEPVGSYPPNAWGLYDMYGNVWEWCSDYYSPQYDLSGPQVDPQGPATGTLHVSRGGCWSTPAEQCASAYRNGNTPPDELRQPLYGLRVVCELVK